MRTGSSDSGSTNSRGAASGAGTGSQLYPGNADDPWIQQPVQFRLQNAIPRADLDKDRKEGKLSADLSKIGLAPSKEAYQQRMADLQSEGKLVAEKPQSRLSKFFFGDREKNRPPAEASLKPCVDKECKPAPLPCAGTGKNCRPLPPCQGVNCATPPPPPQNTGCEYLQTGSLSGNSYCQPLGYVDHCDASGTCYAHLGQVNGSYCNTILQQVKQEQKNAKRLLMTQQAACSANAASSDCTSATNTYQASQSLLQQLAAQYQMCRAAAGLGPANVNLGPAAVPATPSSP